MTHGKLAPPSALPGARSPDFKLDDAAAQRLADDWGKKEIIGAERARLERMLGSFVSHYQGGKAEADLKAATAKIAALTSSLIEELKSPASATIVSQKWFAAHRSRFVGRRRSPRLDLIHKLLMLEEALRRPEADISNPLQRLVFKLAGLHLDGGGVLPVSIDRTPLKAIRKRGQLTFSGLLHAVGAALNGKPFQASTFVKNASSVWDDVRQTFIRDQLIDSDGRRRVNCSDTPQTGLLRLGNTTAIPDDNGQQTAG